VKILIHGINFAPELTGVGKYTGEMVEWLAARGHDVRVVTAPPYYPDWRVRAGFGAGRYARESWRGSRVWRCPVWVPAHPGGLQRILHLSSFAASSFPVMVRQLPWRPDVVWVAEPSLFCVPAAVLVARLGGARAWLHVQDYEVDTAFDLGVLRGAAMRRAFVASERWLMRRFDRVSAISSPMRERALTKGVEPERLIPFPNWASMDSPASAEESNQLRTELDIGQEEVVALYAGTLGRKQGLELLAQAAASLQGESGLVFVFCGNGLGRDKLVAQCHGLRNVRFLDLQPVERLGALLRMADIHLLPQKAAAADLGLPSKLTGMLASGRPVIATCVEGTELAREVVDRGVVVPPGDGEAFADAIRGLAHDGERRTRLGVNARAYAEEFLARDVVLARFESALQELVRPRLT
jgi:colanic acid biosynthesis glycosyl transferase WcaI